MRRLLILITAVFGIVGIKAEAKTYIDDPRKSGFFFTSVPLVVTYGVLKVKKFKLRFPILAS